MGEGLPEAGLKRFQANGANASATPEPECRHDFLYILLKTDKEALIWSDSRVCDRNFRPMNEKETNSYLSIAAKKKILL